MFFQRNIDAALTEMKVGFRLFLLGVCWAVLCGMCSRQGFAEVPNPNSANTQIPDPVRPGDHVEVRYLSKWCSGTVVSMIEGKVSVQYSFNGRESTRDFALADIRFPNGEGQWALWKTSDGKLRVEARYIARDETSVMIRKEDGSELTLPIDSLTLDLRQKVKRTPITGEENKIDGADPVRLGDEVEVSPYSNEWFDGVVTQVRIGEAQVRYQRLGQDTEDAFPFAKIRFPNGEGPWRKWSDTSGQFTVIARYLSRTETQVTLRKQDGTNATVPIDRLSLELKRWTRSIPITGKETLIDGVSPVRVGDTVEVSDGSRWVEGLVSQSGMGIAFVERFDDNGVSQGKREFPLTKVRYPNGEGSWRKWTGRGGSTVVARMLSRDETHVVLLKEDGQNVRVPIDQLDRGLQQELEHVVPQVKRPKLTTFVASGRSVGLIGTLPDFRSFPSVQPLSMVPSWSDGSVSFPIPNADTISTIVPIAGKQNWLLLGTHPSSNYRGEPQSQVHWIGPERQEYKPGPRLDEKEQLVDYSVEQNRMLTAFFPDGLIGSEHWQLSTYQLGAGDQFAEPEMSWEIPSSRRISYQSFSPMARLVGSHYVLVIDSNTAQLYDLKQQRILYSVSDVFSRKIELHPSGDFFVLDIANAGSVLIETLTGKAVAKQLGSAAIGFSPDGSQILRLTQDSLEKWDIGEATEPVIFPRRNVSTQGSPQLLDDRYIWIDGLIYDTQKKAAMWNYDMPNNTTRRVIGNRLAAAMALGSNDSDRQAIVGIAKVPHDNAIALMEPYSVDDMLALRPGKPIRLIQSIDERIANCISAVVTKNGWVPNDGAGIVISGSAGRGPTETHVYDKSRFSFAPFMRNRIPSVNAQTVSVSPWKQSVEVRLGELVLWSRSMGFVPSTLRLEDGESAQQKVDELTQPSYTLFERLEIPAEVFYPVFRSGAGRTSLTPGGFVDQAYSQGASAGNGR
ncbi:SHD1 domain-containing protein [Neorhodopirellula pilleata]|uniref:SLA1 homology domain-containing protein n=1 Tax=Neorhodopirellula pilleata TaxID=2714738 RepID=A0A5C6AGM7_9BACT|nr:SHD1 domain-containing protein [Neorhodopirellula pilleata]TWT97363.1 hypothetical protein Pla100_25150 [Neorhodopirellula pilleata]